MTNSSPDIYFDNVQLLKLVSSAEVILQHLYTIVSKDEKIFIEQWLCFKHEYDEASSVEKLDFNENVKENDLLSTVDEEVEEEEEVYESSSESISSTPVKECTGSDTFELVQKEDYSDNDISEDDDIVDQLMDDFKVYTDSVMSMWFNNINISLLEDPREVFVDQSHPPSSLGKANEMISKESHQDLLHLSKRENRDKYNPDTKWTQHDDESSTENPFQRFPKLFNEKAGSAKCSCSVLERKSFDSLKSTGSRNNEIDYLRSIRDPLIDELGNVPFHWKRFDLETSSDFRVHLKYEEVIELLDTSIEMKNHKQLVIDKTNDFLQPENKEYSVIGSILKVLSLKEVSYLLVSYLNRVVDLRENSSTLDALILRLDNVISDRELRIRYLKEMLAKHKNKQTSLVPWEMKDKELENVIKAAQIHSCAIKPQNTTNIVPMMPHDKCPKNPRALPPLTAYNIPERTLKTLQTVSTSEKRPTNVIRERSGQREKLIIQTNKSSRSRFS